MAIKTVVCIQVYICTMSAVQLFTHLPLYIALTTKLSALDYQAEYVSTMVLGCEKVGKQVECHLVAQKPVINRNILA